MPGHRNHTFFTLKDALKSDTAERNSINNVPGVDKSRFGTLADSSTIIHNIKNTFKYLVNPLKLAFPQLAISSGYRCYDLNSKIKGDSKSKHMYGYAVDIYDSSCEIPSFDIFKYALINLPNFHQIIWEFPENGRGKSSFKSNGKVRVNTWIHIDYILGNNLRKISLASKDSKIHKKFKKDYTNKRGVYTHGLKISDFVYETISVPIQTPPTFGIDYGTSLR